MEENTAEHNPIPPQNSNTFGNIREMKAVLGYPKRAVSRQGFF
jgi:hypothetical protein